MLLYSTILDINDSLTKEEFIKLVIKWNQESPHKSNVIKNLVWNGERNIKWGDDKVFLILEEYRNKNIIAVRYGKTEEDGAVWCSDYIMNFDEMKMSIQLDRSYIEEAQMTNTYFSTPHFITMLIENGYLKDDNNIPVSNKPLIINEDNIDLIIDVINGDFKYKLPVVFVSKNNYNCDPIDVKWICSKLKGVAHVFLQESVSTNKQLRNSCSRKNEYYGAIGIYYPNEKANHTRYLYHKDKDYDKALLEKVVQSVIRYSNVQNINSLYTWYGVKSALLTDKMESQRSERLIAEKEKIEAKNEVDEVYATFNEDIIDLKNEIAGLKNDIQALTIENNGLKEKLDTADKVPIIFQGNEEEIFAGEIKDFVLSILKNECSNMEESSRKWHVIKDIVESNNFQNLGAERKQKVKKLLNSYNGMTNKLKSELETLGFSVDRSGNHYVLMYGEDQRYKLTISKTPSDNKTGKNSAQTIIRNMM